MSLAAGSVVTVEVDKAVAGGRMLARHGGEVVLLWGAVPGERVRARVDRRGRGVVYASTMEVLAASTDRREATGDWRCGGSVFAHVAYARQLRLKSDILVDAFRRLGRVPLAVAPEVMSSPEHGYRMRARLHARDGAIGFYRENTHDLCDPEATGQLLPSTLAWVKWAEDTLRRERLAGLETVEISETIAGESRVCHLELHAGVDPAAFRVLGSNRSVTGLSARVLDRPAVEHLMGAETVEDGLRLSDDRDTAPLRIRRSARSFFQSNRFLLEPLVRHVVALVPEGPVVDLYAGVGLFGLASARVGRGPVLLVEGDPTSGADLTANAVAFGSRVRVERQAVEAFLQAARVPAGATFIVDPPRVGLSKDALARIVTHAPRRLVYVSCDVATLARDSRALIDAGYELHDVTGVDLFPNTAHVECVTVFCRPD